MRCPSCNSENLDDAQFCDQCGSDFAPTCPSCKTGIHIAPMPPTLTPKSLASPSLLAYVATSKYADALPLYRQESILQCFLLLIGGRSPTPVLVGSSGCTLRSASRAGPWRTQSFANGCGPCLKGRWPPEPRHRFRKPVTQKRKSRTARHLRRWA